MKKFLGNHSKIFGALFGAILSVVLISGMVFAAGFAESPHITGATGTITVDAPPLVPDYTYTLDTNTLNFGTTTHMVVGTSSSFASSYVTVLNTGNQPISGLTVNVINLPAALAGATVTVNGSGIVKWDGTGNNYQFQIIILATPSSVGTIDMSDFVCTITPY